MVVHRCVCCIVPCALPVSFMLFRHSNTTLQLLNRDALMSTGCGVDAVFHDGQWSRFSTDTLVRHC